MKFSTVIVALNGEGFIREALASVAACDDIVVVLDDRTTDETGTIAGKAGARVILRKFDGFASQKNFGIDSARYDWVLILDTDERLTPELQQSIQKLGDAPDAVAYQFAWRNYLGSKWLAHGGLYPDFHTRLFDRRHARYGQREIHETLEIKGETQTLKGDVIHLTYHDVGAYYAKVVKYARLEAEWTKIRPSLWLVLKEFLSRYLKQSGYKDGRAGLVSAGLLAYYRYIVRRSIKP